MLLDKLSILCARLSMTTCDFDSFLTITNVNINFTNNAGLLSTMTPEQLYEAYVSSGLRSMSWIEFSDHGSAGLVRVRHLEELKQKHTKELQDSNSPRRLAQCLC